MPVLTSQRVLLLVAGSLFSLNTMAVAVGVRGGAGEVAQASVKPLNLKGVSSRCQSVIQKLTATQVKVIPEEYRLATDFHLNLDSSLASDAKTSNASDMTATLNCSKQGDKSVGTYPPDRLFLTVDYNAAKVGAKPALKNLKMPEAAIINAFSPPISLMLSKTETEARSMLISCFTRANTHPVDSYSDAKITEKTFIAPEAASIQMMCTRRIKTETGASEFLFDVYQK